MLAASDWRRGGFFSMAQEIEKHSTPMVAGMMQTATELKQSITSPQHRLILNMDCNEVPPILRRPAAASDAGRQLRGCHFR